MLLTYCTRTKKDENPIIAVETALTAAAKPQTLSFNTTLVAGTSCGGAGQAGGQVSRIFPARRTSTNAAAKLSTTPLSTPSSSSAVRVAAAVRFTLQRQPSTDGQDLDTAWRRGPSPAFDRSWYRRISDPIAAKRTGRPKKLVEHPSPACSARTCTTSTAR